jgi:hypothetical protein
MEVDIDVASSSVARHVVGLVSGASKSVVVDMGILLQAGWRSCCCMATDPHVLRCRMWHPAACSILLCIV